MPRDGATSPPRDGATGPEVLGPSNRRIKQLRRLVSTRRARAQDQVFVVEGPVLVAEALDSELAITEIFYEDACEAVSVDRASVDRALIGRAIAEGLTVSEVAEGVLASALSTVSPKPMAAVVETPSWAMADIGSTGGVLILASLRDPGNVGTLIRTAEAAGFGGVVLAGSSVDYTNPKVVRSSAGAMLRMPIVVNGSLAEAVAPLREAGHQIVAAALDPDAVAYDQLNLSNAAIVVGNEAHGLSPAEIAECDVVATIPLAGPTESLNVAAAGAILCFASWQQFRVLNEESDRMPKVSDNRGSDA